MNTDLLFTYDNPSTKITEKLTVTTGANSIYWGYGINTQTYPTYGGEVVQILSCYITDLQIEGDCRNYLQMEDIYRFFAEYMQYASQGVRGKGDQKYLTNPVKMNVPSRGWNLKIVPKSVPGFRLGTEVVAPQWQLVAQVYEDDANANQAILSSIASKYYNSPNISIAEAINKTTTLSQIGYNPDSGFVNPLLSATDTKGKTKPNKFDGEALKEAYTKRGEAYRQIVKSYIDNDSEDAYGTLFVGNEYSKPTEDKKDGKKDQQDKNSNNNNN